MKKRTFCIFLAAALTLGALCGCATGGNSGANASNSTGVSISAPSKGKTDLGSRLVGISLPEQEGRWEQEAAVMQQMLEEKGYIVELAYASQDSDAQIEQVKAMLDDNCGAVVIAAVDSEALADALETCDTSNTTIIAYNTMIPDCGTVDYFIGVDSYTDGQIQAKALVKKLGLNKTKKSLNIELFYRPGNGSGLYAFLGAMDVLKPYLDDSTLVIPSGNMTAEECSVTDAEDASETLGHLLESTYADGKPLDAILCTDGTVSVGIVERLDKSYSGSVFPVIASCNWNPENLGMLTSGRLVVTSVESTPGIAQQAAKMADQAMNGQEVECSKEDPYDMPAYLYEPIKVTAKNYKKALIDSGLYRENKDGTLTAVVQKAKTEDAAKDTKEQQDKKEK